jgi:UDP-glucose 4-epimerase
MTPLLEVELLRAAVNGKQGMWQLLADHADELGLDAADYLRRSADADRQQETLERLHAEIRPEALRPD